MNNTDAARAEAKRLYLDEDLSLRQIADRMDCSRETVRLRLLAAGVALRPHGKHTGAYAVPPTTDTLALMDEIVSDIRTEFKGRATVVQLREWLGEPCWRLRRALEHLRARGDVVADGDVYFTSEAA